MVIKIVERTQKVIVVVPQAKFMENLKREENKIFSLLRTITEEKEQEQNNFVNKLHRVRKQV